MTQLTKRTIAEISVRHRLEPELRDVYVEGQFDRDILISAQLGLTTEECTIYPIQSIDVPQEILNKYDLTTGNKQRVIALAKELAKTNQQGNYLCLIDRDLDHWFEEDLCIAKLKPTKYCSIECHLITPDAFNDIAILVGKVKVASPEELFISLISVLKSLYSVRLTDRELGLNLSWIPVKKYLSRKDSSINFDINGYIKAVLNKKGLLKEHQRFCDATKNWSSKFSDEYKLCCRGHDYTELLAWVIQQFNGIRQFADINVVTRTLVLEAKGNTDIAAEIVATD